MNPTHRKPAVEVELLLFTIDEYGDPTSIIVTRRGNHDEYYVYNELRKSEHNILVGDYINMSTPGDIYPIPREVVESTYEKIK